LGGTRKGLYGDLPTMPSANAPSLKRFLREVRIGLGSPGSGIIVIPFDIVKINLGRVQGFKSVSRFSISMNNGDKL